MITVSKKPLSPKNCITLASADCLDAIEMILSTPFYAFQAYVNVS